MPPGRIQAVNWSVGTVHQAPRLGTAAGFDLATSCKKDSVDAMKLTWCAVVRSVGLAAVRLQQLS